MSNKLDFEKLASTLLSRIREVLPSWLPGGRMVGNEYTCGSLRGEPGDSCKVNVNTGKWADFAAGHQGGDLTSLYAAIEGIDQGEAARRLAEQFTVTIEKPKPVEDKLKPEPMQPPRGCEIPDLHHFRYGNPSASWVYRDLSGDVLFVVARYDQPEGKKQIVPWSYNTFHKWQAKAWPTDRPLYGLEELGKNPDRAVLIVEGEKAADAARQLVGTAYNVVTWSGGVQAWKKTDWKPLSGKRLLLWPDADKPGREAVVNIVQHLYPHCPEIKTLNVGGKFDGWDAADAVLDGMTKTEFFKWAKGIVVQQKPAPVEVIEAKFQQIATSSLSPTAERIKHDMPTIRVSLDEGPRPTASMAAAYDKLGIACSESTGSPICNADNCLRVLQGLPQFKDIVWYDEFHFRFFTKWQCEKPREWNEDDSVQLMILLQRELGFHRVTEKQVQQAIRTYGLRNIKNEPKDWMNSLEWDDTPRVDEFFVRAFGSKDSEYMRAISRNFWISMAARVFKPGCKFDNMVILEGGQGKFKSTALEIIGSPWYVVANESILTKDFYLQLHGRLVVEIAELDGFSKAEVNTIKKVISTASDRFRPPYGHTVREFPRMSVFAGSTNDDEYLRDPTGGRRFWPCLIEEIDLKYITAQREQLFAEAVARFKSGATWYQVPKEMAEAEQEKRRQSDAWEDAISEFMIGRADTTAKELWESALHGSLDRFNKPEQIRISRIMRVLGYETKQIKRLGVNQKRYIKMVTEETMTQDANARIGNQIPLGVTRPRNYAPGADNSHLDDDTND